MLTLHCLFCGVLSREAPRVAHLRNLVCRTCFEQVGITFAAKGEKTRHVLIEFCLCCGRNERTRQLVGGVAAAICRPCYRRAGRERMPLAENALAKVRPRIPELKISPATVLEIRRQWKAQKRRRLPAHASSVEVIKSVLDEDRLAYRIRSHLALLEPGPESELEASRAAGAVPKRKSRRDGR